jgi:dimethylaniline monooxygenase (N-oxide forming)
MYDVVIVGGGFSGIYTLKHCIELGLNAIILEKSENLGGVWNINNKPGGVHNFTFSVTSALYLSTTDFLPPEDWPEFPHSSLVNKHLMNYTTHFGLEKYILKSKEVNDVTQDKQTKIWTVITTNQTYQSKNVVIATGVNMCPVYPTESFFNNFKGKTYHTHYYNEAVKQACVGKRVLIVGGSDHASDIANDICRSTKSVHVSIRNGQWFQDRMFGAHSPADMYYSRYINFFIKNFFGKKYVHNTFNENFIKLFWGEGGSDIDAWQPKCDYLNSYYNKSRDIIRLVGHGLVKPCGKVISITNGNVVTCEHVKEPFDIDIIIYATGYKYSKCMKYLETYVKQPRFRHIFPIYEDGSIAFIGYIRPYLTSIPMLIEIQSRVVSQVFAKRIYLPDAEKLYKITMKEKQKQEKEFSCNTERMPFLVDPYDYCDSMAKLINAIPSYFTIMLCEPFLYSCIVLDSWNPFVYRLNDEDPDKRKLAREVIIKYNSHKTSKKIRTLVTSYILRFFIALLLIILLLTLLYFYNKEIISMLTTFYKNSIKKSNKTT